MSIFNNIIVKVTELLPKSFVHIFAKKYISGETLESAINLTKDLNARGIYTTIDVLGESITTKEEAIEAKNKAMDVLDAIVEHNLNANLSLKPTQMGLSIDEDFAFEQVLELAKRAKEIDNFVRIDMEDSPYTDKTIRLYKRIYDEYKNVGIVVQAYLKRTYDDVIELNKLGTNYRLCKGIYNEPAKIAYKDKQEVRDNFMKILEKMLDEGNYVGIATHDDPLIEGSYKMLKEKNIPGNKYEFQMLLGVKEKLRDKINEDGHKIRIYVPFGKDWYPYSIRRLKENPDMAGHIFKSIFRFGN